MVNDERPLLIGEDNPYGSDPRYALYPEPPNSAGGRLCRLVLGLTATQYVGAFDRANLCAGKWSVKEARARAREIALGPPRPAVVLLGAKVCIAFGRLFEPFIIVPTGFGCPAVILPHPSGRCQLWNDPGAFARGRAVLREAGVLPADGSAPPIATRYLPGTDSTTRRPARCSNCGRRVAGEDCIECGPPR